MTDKIFSTTDLGLAAYLLARGHELVDSDGRVDRLVTFYLEPVPSDDMLAAFAGGQAVVNVRQFLASYHHLKQEIWSARRATRRGGGS